uniref:Uncharacterized protein n=1 Tax=Kalanchoe fedtschenkoi TaxID=63787 RepID=A0A7N0UJ87_KALFE
MKAEADESCDLGYQVAGDSMDVDVVEDGCSTPKRAECRIPASPLVCPPPPARKKPFDFRKKGPEDDVFPAKVGFFHPPDLEALFSMPPRRGFCT